MDGVLNSITTYILFWTLVYNSVHIFYVFAWPVLARGTTNPL